MGNRVSIHPWTVDDLPVLERSNTPEMTSFLGGPETPEQLALRHAKFLRLWQEGEAWMFTIRVPSEELAVGSVGYWTKRWNNADVYETGWSIATPYQGRGYASRALAACLEHAARCGDRAEVYAFPRIDNAASSSVKKRSNSVKRAGREATQPCGKRSGPLPI